MLAASRLVTLQLSTLGKQLTVKLKIGVTCNSTVLVIIKLTKNAVPLRFRCGSGKLTFCLYFINFAIFKNVVHSLEPGETPSYSASHQVSNYVQRSIITQNTLKRCVAVALRLRLFFQFT